MAKIKRHTLEVGDRTVRLWGETAKLQRFFPDIEADETLDPDTTNVDVKTTTVRKYPGGPTYTRKSHKRKIDKTQGLNRSALPGRRFWVEVFEGIGPLREKKVFQFNFQGPWQALKVYLKGELTPGQVARSPSGRSVEGTKTIDDDPVVV